LYYIEQGHICFVWYEPWSLTITEKHGLKAFQNRVVREIFRPKTEGSNIRLEKTV